jgi:hypothetical protein
VTLAQFVGGRMSDLASGSRDPFWAAAMVTFGISLTAAWVILIGYGLIRLVEHVV